MKLNESIEKFKKDYHLFIDIQMGKYLKSVNQSEFQSDKEAQNVLGKIIEAYNELIAPEHDRLDNSTTEAKAAWFNSIQINFSENTQKKLLSEKEKIRQASLDMIGYYDELLPFLPKGSVALLLFADPALEEYGYSISRLTKILDGEKPTEIEKDILNWAVKISSLVMSSYLSKKSSDKEKNYKLAVEIACEEFDRDTALSVIAEIFSAIKKHFTELKEEKNDKKNN
jgi:hypothetical protein